MTYMHPRPPTRAERPSFLVQRRGVRMPASVVEELLRLSERESEGRLSGVEGSYFGSTYFTWRLGRVRGVFAGRTGLESSESLMKRISSSPLLRTRMVRAARLEAERRVEAASGGGVWAPVTARMETAGRAEGERVVFEVSVELECVSVAGPGGAG